MAKRLFQLDLSKVEVSTEMIKREELDNVVLPEEDKPEDTVYSELKDDGVDIEKDTAALEDISNQLDTAIQAQADLTDQLEANKSIENPTTENVADSEVAIESALVKLGVSREEYGLHNRAYKSLTVSQEGVKLVIEKIVKTIKDLIKKSIRFFKDLFNKIRLKLGNYKPKIEELKKRLTDILENHPDRLSDDKRRDPAMEELERLDLINASLYVGPTAAKRMPRFHANSVLACSALADWISKCLETLSGPLPSKKGIFSSSTGTWQDALTQTLNGTKFNNETVDKNITYRIEKDWAGFYLGGSGYEAYFVEIVYAPEEHPEYPSIKLLPAKIRFKDLLSDAKDLLTAAIKEPKVAAATVFILTSKQLMSIIWHFVSSSKLYLSTDYRSVLSDFIACAPSISKMVDEGPKVFADIEVTQKKLEALTEKLSKASNTVSEEDTEAAKNSAEVAKYIKAVSTDISGAITKVYFSTIRDYLVVGNLLLKYFGK